MTEPLKVSEVAELERVSEKSIRNEIKAGRLLARQIGTHYRIDSEELAAWRERTKVKPRKVDNFGARLRAVERGVA
jgi:excisionase family DNA binding protein